MKEIDYQRVWHRDGTYYFPLTICTEKLITDWCDTFYPCGKRLKPGRVGKLFLPTV